MVTILVVLQGQGCGFERVRAALIFNCFLQIEVLDRKVIVAVLIRTANRLIVGLTQRASNSILLGEVSGNCVYTAVDEHGRVIGLGRVEGRIPSIFFLE